MNNTLFDKMLTKVPEDVKALIDKQYDVAEQIDLLRKSKKMTQKALANTMGKNESYVSRVLAGIANLTLKSIIEFEIALDAKILLTPIVAEVNISPKIIFIYKDEVTTNAIEDYNPVDPKMMDPKTWTTNKQWYQIFHE